MRLPPKSWYISTKLNEATQWKPAMLILPWEYQGVYKTLCYRILSLLNIGIIQLIPWKKNFLLKYIFRLHYICWHDIKVIHCLYDFNYSPVRNISHSTTEVAGRSSMLCRHYNANLRNLYKNLYEKLCQRIGELNSFTHYLLGMLIYFRNIIFKLIFMYVVIVGWLNT